MYKMKDSMKYGANICKYNCTDCSGSSACLLRGYMTQRKAGTCPGPWWGDSVRVPSTWVMMYLAESSTPLSVHGFIHSASCLLPFTNSWFALNLNWAILAFFFFFCSVSCMCIFPSNLQFPYVWSFLIILSHPGLCQQLPGSVRNVNLELSLHIPCLGDEGQHCPWFVLCPQMVTLCFPLFKSNKNFPNFSSWQTLLCVVREMTHWVCTFLI